MTHRWFVAVTVLAALGTQCGGSPTTPAPTPEPPAPLVNNSPPVIVGFTVQGTRNNEPANFADLNEELPVSVNVTDIETPVANLKYNWSSTFGTFSGTGAKVTWRAPANATTPLAITLNLEVVETYTSAGKATENKATGSVTVSLHDSINEVGDMSRQFLIDFSDSGLRDISYIMRNFEPTCDGAADETSDVTKNRTDFTIQPNWRVQTPTTTVAFGRTCPFRSRPGDACSQIRTFWKSTANQNIYDASGNLVLAKGQETTASGVDQVTAKYYPNQQRWRLCASDFNGDDPPQTSLISRLRSLVP